MCDTCIKYVHVLELYQREMNENLNEHECSATTRTNQISLCIIRLGVLLAMRWSHHHVEVHCWSFPAVLEGVVTFTQDSPFHSNVKWVQTKHTWLDIYVPAADEAPGGWLNSSPPPINSYTRDSTQTQRHLNLIAALNSTRIKSAIHQPTGEEFIRARLISRPACPLSQRSTLDWWQRAMNRDVMGVFQRIVGGEVSCWQNNETLRGPAVAFLCGMIFLCSTKDWLCFGKCSVPLQSGGQRSEQLALQHRNYFCIFFSMIFLFILWIFFLLWLIFPLCCPLRHLLTFLLGNWKQTRGTTKL